MEHRPSDHALDDLVKKYLRVWVWSIVFGLDTALTLSLSTQVFVGKYPLTTTFILAIPAILSASFVIFSWWFLSVYLTLGLLPLLITNREGDRDLEFWNVKSIRYLQWAMQFSIFAVIFRVLGIIIEVIFGSLRMY
jgi:hypothetical protein